MILFCQRLIQCMKLYLKGSHEFSMVFFSNTSENFMIKNKGVYLFEVNCIILLNSGRLEEWKILNIYLTFIIYCLFLTKVRHFTESFSYDPLSNTICVNNIVSMRRLCWLDRFYKSQKLNRISLFPIPCGFKRGLVN